MKMLALIIGLTIAAAANAGTAFFKYEYVTGMTKQCVYDYLGSQVVRTMPSYAVCPVTIQV